MEKTDLPLQTRLPRVETEGLHVAIAMDGNVGTTEMATAAGPVLHLRLAIDCSARDAVARGEAFGRRQRRFGGLTAVAS